MKLPRRRFLHLAAGAAALPAASRFAWAQAYPARPVRLIIGYPPGSGPDINARLIGQWLSERLGQPFVIDNRPGAGSNIGTEAVVRAPADGYTLLIAASANASNATLYDKLDFNFIRDIAPVASFTRAPFVMEVHPSVPTKTVPEFIAYAKGNPGRINMASSGNGTVPHLAGELFKMMTGVDMVHVPYRGGTAALVDLLRGQVQVRFGSLTEFDPIHQRRQAARAGSNHGIAFGSATGHPNGGRVPAWLRRERLDWRRGTQKHARRDHRETQQGDQCRPRRS